MPTQEQAAMPPAVPDAALAAAAPVSVPRGLTAARFYSAVAAASSSIDEKMTAKQARAFLMAVKEVIAGEFARGVQQIAVPHVCRLRMRTLAARGPSMKTAFGKQVEIRARGASRVLKASPAKTLKDRCCVDAVV